MSVCRENTNPRILNSWFHFLFRQQYHRNSWTTCHISKRKTHHHYVYWNIKILLQFNWSVVTKNFHLAKIRFSSFSFGYIDSFSSWKRRYIVILKQIRCVKNNGCTILIVSFHRKTFILHIYVVLSHSLMHIYIIWCTNSQHIRLLNYNCWIL